MPGAPAIGRVSAITGTRTPRATHRIRSVTSQVRRICEPPFSSWVARVRRLVRGPLPRRGSRRRADVAKGKKPDHHEGQHEHEKEAPRADRDVEPALDEQVEELRQPHSRDHGRGHPEQGPAAYVCLLRANRTSPAQPGRQSRLQRSPSRTVGRRDPGPARPAPQTTGRRRHVARRLPAASRWECDGHPWRGAGGGSTVRR